MHLCLLGTTGYHPNDRRQTACMMLPEMGVVLDAGTAMYRVREQLCTSTLDIFLTHAHLDHIVGLTFLLDVLYGKQLDRVTVHGEAEKLRAVEQHLFAEELFPVPPPFESSPLETPVELVGGGVLTAFPLVHPGGALGFRIESAGRSLAYVTDTTAEADASYIEAIRGVDLLVHECYFPDGWEDQAKLTGHSCTTAVARLAKAAAVGRLVLVHINPLSNEEDPIGLDVARSIFPQTDIGIDGMKIDV